MSNFTDFLPETTEPNHEATEWTIHYNYNSQDTAAPRALLIGDSIVNGYHSDLRQRLEHKMNLSFWASSFCITHPNYMEMLDIVLRGPRATVILLNNGLHTPRNQDFDIWKNAFRKTIAFLRAQCPDAPLLLVNSTPLQNDPEGYVPKINAATAELASCENLPLLDLYALCSPWDHASFWSDNYHFIPEGRARQADFLAKAILNALPPDLPAGASEQQESPTGPDGKIQ